MIADTSREKKMNNDVVQIRLKNVEPLKINGKIFKSAYDWKLTDEDLEKAARELGETEERKKNCLQKLKKKLSSEFYDFSFLSFHFFHYVSFFLALC